jgi:hypothetical protein
MPNRGSSNTFAGEGFPINWLALTGSWANLQFSKEGKKRGKRRDFQRWLKSHLAMIVCQTSAKATINLARFARHE